MPALRRMPSVKPEAKIGCSEAALLRSNTTCSRFEMVRLALILGGDETTLGRVSRMEVREGTMAFPVMVVSQYLRFWGGKKMCQDRLCEMQ